MSDASYPVTILVKRPDGSNEAVRIGTAVRVGDTFQLSLGELSIGTTPDRAPAPPAARASATAPSRGDAGGMVFPPYGRSKGAPIAGASISDLEFYIQGSRRSLDDPSKSRWHDKERVLLAAMEAELARQKGGGSSSSAAPSGGGSRGGFGGGDEFDEPDGPSPFSDDDIPF